MKLQLVFALMGILLTGTALAHEVQGEAPAEFQPLVLDRDPLLDVRVVEKGVMTPDRGCWMDALSCVWVSHYCRPPTPPKSPIPWALLGFTLGCLGTGGLALWLEHRPS